MLKEAVPYDFGGIDVIDELTVAPSKKKDPNKSGEQVQSETTTQSTVSGSQTNSPDEPSLQNVVTAAEDFIKVLATVSTSQSSATDSEKSDAQTSDKKKKKTSGKKKKTKKTKGKGRKKKQKGKVSVKIDDSTVVSLSSSKAEEAIGLSHFIRKSHSPEQPGRKTDRVSDSEYELRSKEETSNEVMKDEPAKDEEEAVSITSPRPVQKKPVKTRVLSTLSSVAILQKAKTRLLRNGKKRSKVVPLHSSNETAFVSENSTAPTASATTSNPRGQSFVSTTESQLIVNTTSIEILKVKRNRSKLRRDREGGKKRRKAGSSAAVVVNENTTVDNLSEAKSLPESPTIPSVPESQEPDFYITRESVHTMALNTSFSVLKRKRQRSREKGLTKRKRKGLSLLNEHLFLQNPVEDIVPILPTPSGALNSPAITTVISRPAVDTQTHREWQVFPPTSMPSVGRKRLRIQGKSRKKSLSAAPRGSNTTSFPSLPPKPAATTVELYLRRSDHSNQSLCTTTSVNTDLSPMQLSIEKVKEQFKRKKRMKSSNHQQ